MKIKVLGCSGGIGGPARTTSLLIDHDILIDAGTGVADLGLNAMAAIDHVFLTHAHLDHIVSLPLMLDSVGLRRAVPLVVHAQEPTLTALREHIFNWQVWPDFSEIPSAETPCLRFERMVPGQEYDIHGRRLRPITVNHTVPAVGYFVSGRSGTLAFTGDTAETEAFWEVANACPDLRTLIIECSFADAEEKLAQMSRHFSPRRLAQELTRLRHDPEILITHLAPGEERAIMREILRQIPSRRLRQLKRNELLDI